MSIELEISDYYSADIDEVWNWTPASAEDVYFHLEIEISEVGKEGGNLFQLAVATPEGLERVKAKYGDAIKHTHDVVLADYSWDALLAYLSSVIRDCSKDTWQESIQCLRQQFLWEYEDAVDRDE